MLGTPRLASYHPASVLGSLARKKNPPIPCTRSMSLAPWRGARAAPAPAAAAPAIATRIAVRRVTSDDLFMLFSASAVGPMAPASVLPPRRLECFPIRRRDNQIDEPQRVVPVGVLLQALNFIQQSTVDVDEAKAHFRSKPFEQN